MAAQTRKSEGSSLPRLGHRSRLSAEGREVTLLLLGHFMVFLTAMAHDELVAEMVEAGWFFARFAERFELLIGFALFLIWSLLTLRLVNVLHRVKAGTAAADDSDGKR